MDRFLRLTGYLGVIAISGCALSHRNQDAEVKHATKQLSPGPHPSYWYEASIDDYKNLVTPQRFAGAAPTVISDGPIVARLQAWVDAMHAYAVSTVAGGEGAPFPKPRVVLLNDESLNAFTAAMPVSYQLPVESNPGTEPRAVESVIWQGGQLNSTFAQGAPGKVELASDLASRQGEVAKAFAYPCVPSFVAPGKLVFSGCDEALSAKHIVSQQTIQYLTVNYGALRQWSEQQLVGVLAHELGHYYRAHPSDGRGVLDSFFFMEQDAGQQTRPKKTADPKALELADKAREAATNWLPEQIAGTPWEFPLVQSIFTQPLSLGDFQDPSKLLNQPTRQGKAIALWSVMAYKCRQVHKPVKDCDTFVSVTKNEKLWSGIVKWEEFTAEEVRAVVAAGAALQAIAKELKVELAPNGFADSEGALLPAGFYVASNTGMAGVRKQVNAKFLAQAKKVVTLLDYLNAISPLVSQLRDQQRAAVEAAKTAGIGWYTYEQEADEIELELLAAVGLNPLIATDAAFVSLQDRTKAGPSFDQCQARFKDGKFGFETGQVNPVRLSSWYDPHHDFCYRIFNIVREIYGHHYELGAQPPMPTGNWSDLVKDLPKGFTSQG